MKHLVRYNQLFEALGVADFLNPLVREVQQNLSDKNPRYSTTIIVNKIPAKLNFELNPESEDYRGVSVESFVQLQNSDLENLEILVSLADTSDSTLMHELKHVHRLISRKLIVDKYYYLNHVGRDVIEHMSELLKDESSKDILTMSLYLVDQDEFEATFNEYYAALKDIIKPEMGAAEKRKAIKDFLDDQLLYQLYTELKSQGGFDLANFFKSNSAMNHYLREVEAKMNQFYDDDPDYEKWEDILKDWFNYSQGGNQDQDPDDVVRKINRDFNKMLDKGLRKFSRLYTIYA
jgi:hypothetical protein